MKSKIKNFVSNHAKSLVIILVLINLRFLAFAQIQNPVIDEKEVFKIINFLASDSLKGRGNYSPELDKAADFIFEKFKEAGLEPFPGYKTYFQPFTYKTNFGFYDSNAILNNVIGVLPGSSKADEAIIFSAHYDHIGVNKSGATDTIFNGANDNASGMAAMLTLAKYFTSKGNNKRTIIFCAFAGEEMGLVGSSVLAERVIPTQIKAVINIEMIGSCKRKNVFFITGSHYSNLKKILNKNLKKGQLKIISEPDELQKLFERSDNYPFALKGIPAHTIMCSDDTELCYHQTCDEVHRIDLTNMVKIIKAIAVATETIINGQDTPSRININNLLYKLNPYRH